MGELINLCSGWFGQRDLVSFWSSVSLLFSCLWCSLYFCQVCFGFCSELVFSDLCLPLNGGGEAFPGSTQSSFSDTRGQESHTHGACTGPVTVSQAKTGLSLCPGWFSVASKDILSLISPGRVMWQLLPCPSPQPRLQSPQLRFRAPDVEPGSYV